MRIPRRLTRGARTDSGAVAILVAASALALMVVTAMVLDFGLIRLDRQTNRLAADNAVMAGLRSGDTLTGDMNTTGAVCGALGYLRANIPGLSTLPDGVCSGAPPAKLCKPSDPNGTKTTYTGSTVVGRRTFDVQIVSPYMLSSTSYPGDGQAPLSTDLGQSGWNGCDQLAVIVTQRNKPGLGSVATSGQMTIQARSVGRVNLGTGKEAPALLLLDRTNCDVLTVNTSGGGNTSQIWVKGSLDHGATIHADTDASQNCGVNHFVFTGGKLSGMVAYGSGDGKVAGSITSVAGTNPSIALSKIRDDNLNAYATSGPFGAPGSHNEPSGRGIVTRFPVDYRYLEGVRDAAAEAKTSTNNWGVPAGWKRLTDCSPTATTNLTPAASGTVGSLLSTDNLVVDCSSYNSDVALKAGQVYFTGSGVGKAIIPNATRVYIKGDTDKNTNAVSITGSDTFAIRGGTTGLTACSDAEATVSTKFVVLGGRLNLGGGTFRACNTSVILLGGDPLGCLPGAYPGPDTAPAPTGSPCSTVNTTGNGQVMNGGGAVQDWTAPNYHSGAVPDTDLGIWRSHLEDLALWSESGTGTGPANWQMAGGSGMHTVGVFMVPNAWPFTVTGGGLQDMVNAQYIAASFIVKGGAALTMMVDPNAVVPLPAFDRWTLVR